MSALAQLLWEFRGWVASIRRGVAAAFWPAAQPDEHQQRRGKVCGKAKQVGRGEQVGLPHHLPGDRASRLLRGQSQLLQAIEPEIEPHSIADRLGQVRLVERV